MRAILAALTAAVILAPVAALAGGAQTTRIETRPFYGATVTIEEGVRVFRPLPPHRHIIINPHGQAAVNLTIEDRKIVKRNYHYGVRGSSHDDSGYRGAPVYGTYGGYSDDGHRRGRHYGHRPGGHGPKFIRVRPPHGGGGKHGGGKH